MNSLSVPNYLTLDYRPDLRLLVLRWLRDVNRAELEAGFALARELCLRQAASNWLVDVRRRGNLSATDSAWVAEMFLPAVAQQLAPAPFTLAYLLAPFRAELIRAQPLLHQTVARAESPDQPYRLRTFLDESTAVAWLQSTI